jgi:potassium-transporting ATPase KdpC subunit
MLKPIRASIVILLLMTLLTGLAYPLAMVGAAGAVFPDQAAGSLVVRDGKVVGANLIGQGFAEDRYFHGRLSATGDKPYDAANSSGSNLGPTSKALIERVRGDVDKLGKGVPVDLVTTSASGLDPHISPAAAAWQVPRVAKARGLQEADLQRLVGQYTIGRELGVLGEPRVNVLRLNLALDALAKR